MTALSPVPGQPLESARRNIAGASCLMLLAFSIGASGCERTKTAGEKAPPESTWTLQDVTHDEDKLLLIRRLPLGLSYAEVRRHVPDLSPVRDEIPPTPGTPHLTEADAPARILNRDSRMEFNFREDSLYAYGYWLEHLTYVTSDSLYRRLQDFYSQRFGPYLEEKGQPEEGSRSNASYWGAGGFEVVLVNNIYRDHCTLAWSFQLPVNTLQARASP